MRGTGCHRGENVIMFHYYMFNKPFGCITARRDERHPVVMDWFRELNNPNLSPVGRLDRETEGLLIITDDGKWNERMTRPEFHKAKRYEFTVMGDLTPERIARLESGVLLNGARELTAPAKITVSGHSTLGETMPHLHPEVQSKSRHNPMDRPITFGTITITEGKYRQIRRMMKEVRCLVLQLKRVSMGELVLDPSLAPGQWKELDMELSSL